MARNQKNESRDRASSVEFKMVPIADLHEDPANVRLHPDRNRSTVRASLQEFGQVEALVVEKGTGRVIGGNCRLGELRALGRTEVMVSEVDVHGADAVRLALVLNRSAETAEWDSDGLADIIRSLEDPVGLGWDEGELKALLAEPDFSPSDGEPPDLGTLKPYQCPHCGGEFTLKELKDGQP